MQEKIYVRWELKKSEMKYYVLDWAYDQIEEELGHGYEEEEVTSGLIKTMIEINDENIDYLGFFETLEALKEHLKSVAEEEDKDIKEFGNIEWEGPDFYVNWGVAGNAPVVCNALEALDTEYDVSLENGNWIKWLTGLTDEIYTTVDAKDVLMSFYGCEIDNPCEQVIENYILGFFDTDKLEGSIITDEVNNFTIQPGRRILQEAPVVSRLDPASLTY